MIFQMNIVYDSGMLHITTRIPNQSHWRTNLRNLRNLKSENATLLLSVPAPTPAVRRGSGSLSDVGGALAVVSERAPGNGPHQVQRGNAQGLASRQALRQHHVRHHANRTLDSATPHQHTTQTTKKPAHAPGDATTTLAAADVWRVVLQGYDQNRHKDHHQIALSSSSYSRATTRSSKKPRSGGRKSATTP